MSSKVNGYVLAGGKSSRMGEDKALLSINGITFIEQIVSQLKPLVSKTVIVSNSNLHDDLGYPVICDRIEDIGPIGGIYTILSHTDVERNVILSCDTPFITADLIACLIEKSSGYDVTIITSQGDNHPLLGVYNKSCLPKLKSIIASQKYKLQDALLQFKYQTIEITKKDWYSENLVSNINTPDEYNLAQKVWK